MSQILNSLGYEVYHSGIVRAEGCYLYDEAGRRFADFDSGVWSTALGHNHPRVNRAIIQQLGEVCHLGYRYMHPVVEEAAREVVNTTGLADGKCIFLSSGSEAVEFSVQVARRFCNKPLLLGFSESYLSAYGSAGKRNTQEWHFFSWSECTECLQVGECNGQCPKLQAIPWEQIGGFVFEPGNSSGRIKLPPAALVQTLAGQVRARQGLVVIDEVTTGFGRTGAWYGYQHYGLQPDIIAVGKGIGNGYPVSAVVIEAALAAQVENSFRYAQSHQNDALGSAVAKEVIAIMREERLVERSKVVGEGFLQKLRKLQQECGKIKEVRGRGLMIGVELVEGLPLEAMHRALWERGFLVGCVPAANLFRFYPPLTVPEKEIDALVRGLKEVLK